jgi:hypothetical protein
MEPITRFELSVWAGDDQWMSLDDALESSEALVEEWIAERCSSVVGGLFVDIGGEPWAGEGSVGDLFMTVFWFAGIEALAQGATSFGDRTPDGSRPGGPARDTVLVQMQLVEEKLAVVDRVAALSVEP